MEQHMLYRWTVFQQAHHDVSLPYRLCDGGMHSNAQRCQRIGFGLGAVPGVRVCPACCEAACHGTSIMPMPRTAIRSEGVVMLGLDA